MVDRPSSLAQAPHVGFMTGGRSQFFPRVRHVLLLAGHTSLFARLCSPRDHARAV